MKPLDLPVRARYIGGSEGVTSARAKERLLEALRSAVYEEVVGHHRLGPVQPELAEEVKRTLERSRVLLRVLARAQLDVGDARVAVDRTAYMVIADSSAQAHGACAHSG